MKKSENIADLAQALNKCQSTINDVYKGTQAYNYKYAPLDKVYDEIRPKMTAQGLSLTHQKSFNRADNTIELHSLLMHTSGEWIEYFGSLPFASMKQMNDFQASGSGFTYLERYQTSAIFGITSDEDSDGQGEQASTAQQLITTQQVTEIKNLCKAHNYQVESIADQFGGYKSIENIPANKFNAFIQWSTPKG